ncbi:MAG TPA: YtxH domain-containing protein [Acidobacteriaceae bacterium]|jgi:gas vesicle protein
MTDETQGGGFSWFLLGLGVGAALGVLYAPKPGTETREDILQGAREGSEFLKTKSRVAADQVGSQVNEYVDRGKQVVERGRAQWENYVDRGRQVVAEQADKVSAAVDAGKQAYKSTTSGPSNA